MSALKRETLTNTQRQHKFQDKAADITAEFDEALKRIDWKRRTTAERNLADWVDTYCVGILLDDKPPLNGRLVLGEMQQAVESHNGYNIMMGRGSGKTTYVECATAYAMATGKQKFTVVISQNARSAANVLNDIFRIVMEPDTAFSQDYPEVCFCYQKLNGSTRRRQSYRGRSTEISKTSQQIVFPRLFRKDGTEFQTSGSIITVRGCESGIRGLKYHNLRPTLALTDDWQTTEAAQSQEQVEKLWDVMRRDVFTLGGKQRISVLNTCTSVCAEDLTDRIKNSKLFKTTIFPAIIHYPKNEELWKRYFELWDSEFVERKPHVESLEFYRRNKELMDEGAEVFNPKAYSESDGHISAIQKLLHIRHDVGAFIFESEYQQKALRQTNLLNVSPTTVASRMREEGINQVPDGFVFVCASSDLNTSYGITTSIVAFRPDMTATVLNHFIEPIGIDQSLNDTAYSQAVYNALTKHGKRIAGLGLKLNWVIDAGGRNFDAVTDFTKHSVQLCRISSCAFLGRSSTKFNPFSRSKLRNEINGTLLCGDEAERIRSGSGRKYVFWDADRYKEMVQRAFLSEVGSPGSCGLYHSEDKAEHTEFALQVTNEKLIAKRKRGDGREEYTWKLNGQNNYLDTMAQAFACAGNQGISGSTISYVPFKGNQTRISRPVKRRVKII